MSPADSVAPTIGLSMIVKNEAQVIRRCLESVRPLIDYALIVDTGSTDGTQGIVREYLGAIGLPGEVIDRPWRDFAANRTEALEELRKVEGIDYALVIDADETLIFEPGFSVDAFKRSLTHDLYDVTTRLGGTTYLRPQLFANRKPFRYKAVLHEYLEGPPGPISRATVSGFHNLPKPDGARSKQSDKFRRDAAVLAAALENETDPFLRCRYRFYLAQSYRDAGEVDKAIAEYLHRSRLGYWVEEIFYSLYQVGLLMERQGRLEDALAMVLRAHDTLPRRAEPLLAAARLCRKLNRFEEAYYFAKRGRELRPYPDALFLDLGAYEFGLLDEQQISAYWTARFGEAVELGERLLAESKFPEGERARIVENLGHAQRMMATFPAAANSAGK